MPIMHDSGKNASVSFADAESFKDPACDVLTNRRARELAEGGHGRLTFREHCVRRDAQRHRLARSRDGIERAADRVGVTSGAISQWESGLTLPTSAKLPTIAAALGCTIDELYHDGKEEH